METMQALFNLDGQVALVTGSSRGIGFALARALGQAGATVVINGRSADAVDAAVGTLSGEGLHVVGRAFDVCDEPSVVAAVDEIETTVGPIGILVNNAGIQYRGSMLEYPVEEFRRLVEGNLVSAFVVSKAVGARMVPRGRGKIVNLGSIQSELGRATIVPYAATKGGVKLLTRAMCAELGPKGIQVNALGPGYFATDMTAALVDDPEFSSWVERRAPAGRWGQVEELGGAIVFLCSAASNYVNGHILYVDGGLTSVV